MVKKTINEALQKAVTAYNAGETKAAKRLFAKIIEIEPSQPDANSNMGVILVAGGDLEEALPFIKTALETNFSVAQYWFNYIDVLSKLGRFTEALELMVIARDKGCKGPAFDELEEKLGSTEIKFEIQIERLLKLIDQGEIAKVLEVSEPLLKAFPDSLSLLNVVSLANEKSGNFNAAVKNYKQALEIVPNSPELYYNIGNNFKEQGKLQEAIEAYNKALSIKPDYETARAVKLYIQAEICDWDSIAEDIALIPELGTSDEFVPPFSMLSLEDAPERHRLRSETYAKAKYPQKPLPSSAKPSKKPKRIRIGYFSTDFKEHPLALLIAKVFELHNRVEFEVFGYSLQGSSLGNLRQRLENSFDYFTDVQSMSDKEITLLARRDKIDIVIDLNGYTQNSRPGIFAYRAAPIQINYLGYPGTMGADFMDYIIADENLIPTTSQKYYSEKTIYLPHHYQAQDDSLPIANDTPSRSALGLPEKGFVFCVINSSYKITSSQFSLWMRLLKNVDGSVLWLLESNKWVKANLLKEANAKGVASERLVFAKKVSHEKYLAQFRRADLYLDSFTYNAGTTASNALWAGLPVLTKLGKGYTARMAGSLLQSLGLPELVTTTEEEYECLALELAKSPHNLSVINKKLADNRLSKPLFDSKLFTKHLEDGYQQAYQNYFDGNPPETIIVSK